MADTKPLSKHELNILSSLHPKICRMYLAYMEAIGYGETESGHMIYSGPIPPEEFYPQLSDDKSRVIIGDDFQGYCLGFDLQAQCYGEFSDDGVWHDFGIDFDLKSYLGT